MHTLLLKREATFATGKPCAAVEYPSGAAVCPSDKKRDVIDLQTLPYMRAFFRRRLFVTTETLESAIAALAIIGESMMCHSG